MILKGLKRFLLWNIKVVLMTVGFFICQDIFGLFVNDTLSMLLSATVIGIVAEMTQRNVNTDDTESKPETPPEK